MPLVAKIEIILGDAVVVIVPEADPRGENVMALVALPAATVHAAGFIRIQMLHFDFSFS